MSTSVQTQSDVITSSGSYKGECVGSLQMLMPLVAFSNMVAQLESTAATWAINLANLETEYEDQLAVEQAELAQKYDISNTSSKNYATNVQLYSSDLGVVQSEIQADVKTIDPILTTAQNLPNALSTSLNEFIQEAGTVNQGQQALANDRIS